MNDRRVVMKTESLGSEGGKIKYDEPPNSRLFIVCNKSTTEDEFRSAFQRFGKIEEIWIVKDKVTGDSKGIAYIKFSKTSEAAVAMEEMNGKYIGDCPRPIKAMIAHSKDQGARRDSNEEERLLRLFVMVPKTMTDSDLRDHFSKYGELDYASVVKDKTTRENKGYGYVKYMKMSDAARAFENCDRIFKPMFADPKPTRNFNDNYGSHYMERYHGPVSSFGGVRDDFAGGSNDEPCPRLIVVASSLVNQDQLWKLFDLVPGLDYCDIKSEPVKQAKDQKMVVKAVYNSLGSAMYAKEKLHGFEYPPGHRLIVRYDALLPGERMRFSRMDRESGPYPPPVPAPVPAPAPLPNPSASVQSLIARAMPGGFSASTPGGNQGQSPNNPDLAHIAETFVHAASVLQSAGIQTQSLVPGTGNGSMVSTGPSAAETYDPSYCSVRLPAPQPLAPIDSVPAERLFIVCQPQRPALFVLKDIFGRFGHLIDIYMLNGKTCGYAKYAVKESAERAIATLHGQEVCGSRLKVMLAEPLDAKETGRKRVRTEEEKMFD